MTKARKARKLHLSLVASAIVLFTFGCGGGAPPETEPASEAAEAPPRADLCALLTASDIEEVLGTSPGASEAGNEGQGQCSWAAPEGTEPLVELTLDVASLESFDDFVRVYGDEFGGENPPQAEYHPVEGTGGDWAMYEAEEHKVRVFRGDQVLDVIALGAEESQVVDLATRAFARLP